MLRYRAAVFPQCLGGDAAIGGVFVGIPVPIEFESEDVAEGINAALRVDGVAGTAALQLSCCDVYDARSGAGVGTGGCATGVVTSVDGPDPGAMVMVWPGLWSG